MRSVWVTARYEIRTTLGRKSFWFTTILLPAVVLLLVFLPQLFAGAGDDGGLIPDPGSDARAIGYVDPGGLLGTAPAGLPAGLVRDYDSEAAAQAALAAAEIDRYYLIAEDYLVSGRVTVVQTRYKPLGALEGKDLITYVINTGITGSEMTAGLLLDPTPGDQARSLAPAGPETADDPESAYFLPYLLMFVLYMALVMTSGFMLQSVSKEKENRTAEVLLVSLKPRDLMLGKIAGLSAVGLIQVAIWLAVIFGLLLSKGNIAGMDLNVSGEYAARVIPWAIVYFLFGYVMYAAVYAVLGVLAPTARDAGQFVIVAIIPLIVPLLLLNVFSDAPNGAASTALSLFPLTSPVAMVARLGATAVPWWQMAVGAVLLAAAAYLFVLLTGRLFHAGNLLSTRALSWERLKGLLRPRSAAATAGEGVGPSSEPAGRSAKAAPSTQQPRQMGGAISKQRLYMMAAIAIAMVAIGIVEYTRGDSSGLLIAVAGVVVAAGAYMRYRKGR
ncbi:MAG: ABC transporter permease [Thermoleophilia bacterium]|nr:ABC transporter permease [Thermoleophilia bacterium]